MIKTITILCLLFLNLPNVFCQDVIVQIDATKKSRASEVIITKSEIFLGSSSFEKSMTVKSHSVGSFKFPNHKVGLFDVNGHKILFSALVDSIRVVHDNNDIQIFGKYPGNYKIWTIVNSVRYPYLKEKLSAKNLSSYVSRLDSVYALKLNILDSMKNTVSPDAIDYIKTHINYGYALSYLGKIEPSNVGEINRDRIASQYIKSISFQDFQNDNYVDMPIYLITAQSLILVDAIEKKKDDLFIKQVEVVMSEFTGVARERLLKHTFLNTKIIDSIAPQRLDSLMPFIRQLNLSESAMRIIDDKHHKVTVINQPIHKNIQQTTILKSVDGKKITLKQLLSLHKGKTIVFDIWASWCGPCITQIPNMKAIKAKNKNLQIIYISVDTSEKAWLSAVKNHEIEENQYLLGQDFKSEFAKYLRLGGIPKFLIVNKGGLLTQLDAPPPSFSEFYNKL